MKLSSAILYFNLVSSSAAFCSQPIFTRKVGTTRTLHEESTFPLFSTAPADVEESGITVGETKGAVLYIKDVSISRGSNTILTNVNFRVERGQRWGIVGAYLV